MTLEEGLEKREFTINVLNNDLFPHYNTKTKNLFHGSYDK